MNNFLLSFVQALIAAAVIAFARCALVFSFAGRLANDPQFGVESAFILLLSVAIGTFTVAFVFWILIWTAWTRGPTSGAVLGAVAGLCSGLASHPVTWVLAQVISAYSNGKPIDLFSIVFASLFFSVFSLVIVGIFTVAATSCAGALIGSILGTFQMPCFGLNKTVPDAPATFRIAAGDRPFADAGGGNPFAKRRGSAFGAED